ncbi:hypothetical protein Tco_1211623 [Tanacetum coccineum]
MGASVWVFVSLSDGGLYGLRFDVVVVLHVCLNVGCNLANGNAGLMLTEHEMLMYDLSLKLWDGDADLIYNLNPLIVSVVLIEAQYWVGMMERFSFAYVFSLAEDVMTLHGFHKDETICILVRRPIMVATMAYVALFIVLACYEPHRLHCNSFAMLYTIRAKTPRPKRGRVLHFGVNLDVRHT